MEPNLARLLAIKESKTCQLLYHKRVPHMDCLQKESLLCDENHQKELHRTQNL